MNLIQTGVDAFGGRKSIRSRLAISFDFRQKLSCDN